MRFLLWALMALLAAACQPAEVEGGGEGGVDSFGNHSPGTVVETNYKVCNSGTSYGTSITSANWYIQTKNADGMKETTEMAIDIQGLAFFRKHCFLGGRSLVLAGKVPAVFSNSMDGAKGVLEFRNFLTESSEINDGNFKMVCALRVDAEVMNFAFRGRCLEIWRPGTQNRMVMAPQ